MRGIKFRGKRLDNGGWVYGDLIRHSAVDPFTYIARGTGYKPDELLETGRLIKVLPDSVGEMTGLKDKNSVEIYEGDIVLCPRPEEPSLHGAVEFVEGCFYVTTKPYADLPNLRHRFVDQTRDEVVGNIFDSPELLGREDK